MSSPKPTIIAFDLYGTLLSTASISSHLSTHFGSSKASTIASLWRRYQLEYTWRLNSMGVYSSFSAITLQSLRHALAESAETLSDDAIAELMKAYDALGTWDDVERGLGMLREEEEEGAPIEAYVFSNGTEEMVGSSVGSEGSALKGWKGLFKALITVEAVKCYKPERRVYEHLVRKVGLEGEEGGKGRIWVVSGNAFDVVGARAAGLRAAWVDREGQGWRDRLGELASEEGERGLGPTIVVRGVDEAVVAIRRWSEKHAKWGEGGR